MNKTSIVVKGYFSGFYEWGNGFKDKETKKKWNQFLSELKSLWWTHIKTDEYGSDYLMNCNNIIFLHPMRFYVVLVDSGVMVDGSYFKADIEELYTICNNLAKYCGGTFRMEVSDEATTEYNNFKEYHD